MPEPPAHPVPFEISPSLSNFSQNVSFSVPFEHRLRFTADVAGEQYSILIDCLRPSADDRPKVLLVVESEVWERNPAATELAGRLADDRRINMVRRDDQPAQLLRGGEQIKNSSAAVDDVLRCINQSNLDRRSYVVVVGGGAVLDAVGYAAAIAHRGLRLIRLPTTTLAQADSGVGVKNAINQFDKKNWVGTFAVPWAVINDARFLSSLPDRDFRCGFSEAVKVSLLKSLDDFNFLCDSAKQIADRQMDVSFDAIHRSCLWHLKHIAHGGDPFEFLEARPLDFGHWSAHRMEPMSDFALRHGEAVGIGVALDCIYSSMAHGLPRDEMMAVCKCISHLGLPLWDATLEDSETVLTGLEEFRQHLGGRLTVTMLRRIGHPVDVHEVDIRVMKNAIDRLHVIADQLNKNRLTDCCVP